MSVIFEVLDVYPISDEKVRRGEQSRWPWVRRSAISRMGERYARKRNAGLLVNISNGGMDIVAAAGLDPHRRFALPGNVLYQKLKRAQSKIPDELVAEYAEVLLLAKRAGGHLVAYS